MDPNRAWSCKDLVDHADSWSLAGNVGLLKHMEEFAENLLRQADKTHANLDNLVRDLSSAEIQLDLARNRLLSLQNTQFIESRVYEDDDDETAAEVVVDAAETKRDAAAKQELVRNAVVEGLRVLDEYYDRISITDSESDDADETDCSNFVLHEKDPYINRPLPYVIGTQEWLTKWHAGLAESSEEDEDDEKAAKQQVAEEEFSESDSESYLPIVDRRQPVVVDPYSEEFVNGAVETNGNSVSAQAPIGIASFAEQLAAKLGDVLTTPGPTDPEVNTRPIQKRSGNLFDEEEAEEEDEDSWRKPPPMVSAGRVQTKIPNLFDDDEDEDEDENNKPPPLIAAKEPEAKKRIGGLFDETDEEEEEKEREKPPSLGIKRAPTGGVNVLAGFIPKRQKSSSSSSAEEEQVEPKAQPLELPAEKPQPRKVPIKETKKVLSLFDDTDDLFEDDLFLSPQHSTKPPSNGLFDEPPKTKSKIFDDEDEDDDISAGPPPLFTTKPEAVNLEPEKKKKTTRNLFDESSDDEDNIFDEPPLPSLPSDKVTIKLPLPVETPKTSLFADVDVEVDVDVDVKKKTSLFDDDEDDLWKETPNILESIKEKEKSTEEKQPPPAEVLKPLPGKLKIRNLNINVSALMLGASLPTSTKPAKAKPEENPPQPELESAKTKTKEVEDEKEQSPTLAVLPSITKTRARIQVKRKPSTRQARKAALLIPEETTEPEDKHEKKSFLDEMNEDIPIATPAAESAQGTPRKQLIVDEEPPQPPPLDLPTEESLPSASSLLDTPNKTKIKKISLFDDDDDDFYGKEEDIFSTRVGVAEDLFAEAKTTTGDVSNVRVYDSKPPTATAPLKTALFDSEFDGDDLFASKPKARETQRAEKAVTSLFGEEDDDEEDDLFAPSSSSRVKKPAATKIRSLFGDDDEDDNAEEDIFTGRKTIGRPKVKKLAMGTKSTTVVSKSDPLADLLNGD